MKRKSLTTLLAVAALGMTTGCASSGNRSFWSNPFAASQPDPNEEEASKETAFSGFTRRFRRDKSEELSPEFKAAQKTLKKDPEKSLLAWARYQEDIGEFAEARKMYRELQIAYPDNMEAHLGMARIELLTGRSQQAEEILANLAKENPKNADVRLAFGRMYSQQEKWDEAIRAFEEACEIEPDNQNCRYELGVAFSHAGNFDQALAHLTYAVGEPAANYNIGYILHEQGNDKDAAEWFRNALQLHPDQQTAAKSEAMLAKLSPPSQESGALTSSILARNASPADGSIETQDGSVGAARISKLSTEDFTAGSELPLVSSGRQHIDNSAPATNPENSRQTQPSGEYSPRPQLNAEYSANSSPFRSVSHSERFENEPTRHSGGEPPQWQGPSGTPLPRVSDPLPSLKDPPSWRARRD